jgi:hypothetical protein
VELVATQSEVLLSRIRMASSKHLTHYLASAACTPEIRNATVCFLEHVKQAVGSLLLSKLSYLRELPYKFVGVISH